MSGSATRRAVRVCCGIGLVGAAMPACGESSRPAHVQGPLPPIPVVELGAGQVTSGSRLRAVYWESEEGLRVPTPYFLDTERNETCSFSKNGSDSYCYPQGVDATDTANDLYDARCGTRVLPDCAPYAVAATLTPCGQTTVTVYALADELEGEPYLEPDCTSSFSQPGVRYRRLGARIPDSEFVRATEGVSSADGERLGLHQLSADDGSAIALGFFDRDAGVACNIAQPVADDETLYCVPPSDLINTYFDEETCSGEGRRLAVEACPGSEIAYSRDDELFYRRERSVGAVPPFTFDERFDQSCFESHPGPGHELGDIVPLSTFETIGIQKAGSGRFTLDVWQSSDENVLLPRTLGDGRTYVRDNELGMTCVIQTAADGETRCVPWYVKMYAPGLFADEQCEVPLAADNGMREFSAPRWLVHQPNEWGLGCPDPGGEVVYEVEDEPYVGTLYGAITDTNGIRTCNAYLNTMDRPLYVPKAEVPPSTFGRFERKVE